MIFMNYTELNKPPISWGPWQGFWSSKAEYDIVLYTQGDLHVILFLASNGKIMILIIKREIIPCRNKMLSIL